MLNIWMLTEFFFSGDTLLPVAALYGPGGPTAPITFEQGYTVPQVPSGSLSLGTITAVQSASAVAVPFGLVQSSTHRNAGTLTDSSTLPSATTPGNLVVVFVSSDDVPSSQPVDSGGNAFTGLITNSYTADPPSGIYVYFSTTTAPLGTVTYTSTSNIWALDIAEFSGLGPLLDDGSTANVALSASGTDPVTITTTLDNALSLSAVLTTGTDITPTGYTLLTSGTANTKNFRTAYKLDIGAPGTYTVNSVTSGISAAVVIAAFHPTTLVPFSSDVTDGNSVVVSVVYTASGTPPTVTSTVPGSGILTTYTLESSTVTSGGSVDVGVALFYAANVPGGAQMISVVPGANTIQGVAIYEFSGVDQFRPIQSVGTQTDVDPATASTISVTTTSPDGVLIGVGTNVNTGTAASTAMTADTGFTGITLGGTINGISQYKDVGDTGTYSLAFQDGAVTSNFAEAFMVMQPVQLRYLASVLTNPANIALARTDPRVQVAGTIWDEPTAPVLAAYSADLDGAVTYRSMGEVLSRLAQVITDYNIDL